MAFAGAGFLEDLLVGPIQAAKVICEKNAGKKRGGTGAAAHPEGDFIVEFEMESAGENACVRQDVNVGGDDEIVFDASA